MLIDCQAPDFKQTAYMPDGSFQEVALSDCKGQMVVLFFYPADFTFVCASEVPAFNALCSEFQQRGCQVIGCSTDTHHQHKGWCLLEKEKGGLGLEGKLRYPLVGDTTKGQQVLSAVDFCRIFVGFLSVLPFNGRTDKKPTKMSSTNIHCGQKLYSKEIAKAYDVLLDSGLCTRGVFLIDKNGVVKQEHRNCGPLGRNIQEQLRLLDALIFHEKSVQAGEVNVCPANWKLGKRGIKPTLEGVTEFNKAGGVEL